MTTPVDQLREAARRNPAARVHDEAGSITYAELLDRSLRCAGGLETLGVRAGDRVAFWLPNSLVYLDLLYACFHLGAIAVSVNTRFRRLEAQAILSRTHASAVVLWPGFKGIPFLEMLADLDREAISCLRLAIVHDAEDAAPPMPGIAVVHHGELLAAGPIESRAAADRPGIVFPTTGTTSLPKFATHLQGDIARHAAHVAPAFGYDAPDAHLLQAIPFCGVWGFSQWIGTVAGAASATLMALFDPVEAGRLIRERRVTHLNGADDLIHRLLAAQPDPQPFPSLREAIYATFNPTMPHLAEEAGRRGLMLCNAFGMSEIYSLFSRQSAAAPAEIRRLSGGFPVNPGAEIRIRDTETGALLPTGTTGALEIRSDTMFCGYLDDAEATRAAFTEDGFFRTGDLGERIGDGSFLFRGRAGDALRLGGFLVNPVEIETALQGLGGIREAIVVEVAASTGNRPVAYVRCDDRFDEIAVRSSLKAVLADFKVPRHFVPVAAFPTVMGANGEKIQRSRLKAMAAEAFGPPVGAR